MDESERARMLRNWHDERDSAVLYDALAGMEGNRRLSRVFAKLAESEREHAAYWEHRLRSAGLEVPAFQSSLRVRFMIRLARRFGVGFVVPSITTRELADHDRYSDQEDATAAGLNDQERAHAAIMRRVAAYGQSGPGESGETANLSSNLRAAVLGANDGLVSNFCLIMGVAGGGAADRIVLLTGVAGLIAGACSMALGEWLSVTNALEMANSQMDQDVRELHESMEWKQSQLPLMYEAKGMNKEEARRAAARVIAQDPDAIDTLIHEERTLAAAQLGSNPLAAAGYSFVLFALGACVPLLPFVFATGTLASGASIGASLVALLGLGLLTSFFNGRSPWYSGVRQLLIGAAAAALTYGAGRLVGGSLT